MKSSQKSRATVPQRLMFKEGRKVGRKSVLCHWKGFASGRREGENKGKLEKGGGARERGGLKGEPRRKRDDWKSETSVRRKKVRPRQDRGKVAEGRKKCAVVKEGEQQC